MLALRHKSPLPFGCPFGCQLFEFREVQRVNAKLAKACHQRVKISMFVRCRQRQIGDVVLRIGLWRQQQLPAKVFIAFRLQLVVCISEPDLRMLRVPEGETLYVELIICLAHAAVWRDVVRAPMQLLRIRQLRQIPQQDCHFVVVITVNRNAPIVDGTRDAHLPQQVPLGGLPVFV